MAKQVYNDRITKTTNWGGDASTGGNPVSGERVQEFIKNILEEKVGEVYHDQVNTRYLCFSDAENRDLYLQDREANAALLIAAFDAPANYSAEVEILSAQSVSFLKGEINKTLEFMFDIKNKQGMTTGDSALVTYTITNGGSKQVVKQVAQSMQRIVFLLDNYLLDGQNIVTLSITGRTTLATIMASATYTKIDLSLTSSFDFSIPASVNELSIPITVSGLGQKYIEWYIDSEKLIEEDVISEPSSNRIKTLDITDLSLGTHSVQLRAYIVSSGERFYSKTLYFDFLKGRINKALLLRATLPSGTIAPLSGLVFTTNQYEPTNIEFSTFDPLQRALAVNFLVGEEDAGSIESNNEEIQIFSHTPVFYGEKIVSMTFEDITKSFVLNSLKSLAAIEETTSELRMKLTASGRMNSDINKAIWSDRGFSSTFNNFSWNEQSGWNNGALVIAKGSTVSIDIKPFLPDMAVTGGTIEIDFETIDSENENALLCSCVDPNNNAGIRITATSASIRSSGGAFVETRFKNEERVKLAFIVNKAQDSPDSGLIYIVNNGIVERATNYAPSDTFLNGSVLTIGDSTGKTSMKLRSIRVYSRAITTDEAFANYIIDSGKLLQLYQENDIYEEGTTKVSVDKISSKLPVFIFTGPIPTLEASMDKDLRIYCDIEYINNQDPTKSFTTTATRVRLQGTSSLGYPRKNFRFYTKYGEMFDYEGKKIEGGLYSFKDKAIPVSTWCLKADYAESSSTHNTGVARLWNDVLKNVQVDGQYVGKTQAQAAAEANQYPYDVRTCVDGFPCVMFYRLTPQSDLVFMGQYNFNNDKSTENVFGFTNIPGFDNSKMQCWEVINNTHPLTLFKSVETFDAEWEDAFEARYPDDGSDADTSDLRAFSQWISGTATDTIPGETISINAEIKTDLSTQFQSEELYVANGTYPDTPENRIKKFSKEKWDYLDVYKVAAYYVYLMRFGGVDQTVKNSMFTTEGTKGVGTKCKWFYINYDNDTVLGVRNDARLVYPYDIDRQSKDPLLPDTYAYAGHDSTLWNNLEADDEFMRIVREVDRGLYTAGLTYENINRIFDQEQSSKWCARVYNDNGRYKYISTFKEQGINNLFMLQGTRKSHRHWWVTNRFNLFDALWVSGKYKSSVVEFKAPGATGSFSIQAGAIQRYGYGINNDAIETGIALLTGETKDFTPPRVLAIGDPVRIYAASSVQGINLSNYKENIAQLNVSGAYDEVGGSKLRRLILGDKNTENLALTDISGLNQLSNLEELDIRGFKGITSLDISTLPSLKVVKLDNSGITSFQPAQGVKLDVLSLPSTLQVLSLDKTTINTTFTYNPTISLRTLSLKNTTGIDEKSLVLTWYNAIKDNEIALQNASLTAWGVNWENITPAQLIALKSIGTISLRGYVKLSSMTFQEMNDLVESFGPNIFSQTGELIIDAPPGIVLSGPNVSLAGTEAVFTGVLFPVGASSILYSIANGVLQIIDNQRYWVSGVIKINEATGVLSSDISLAQNTSISVVAKAVSDNVVPGTIGHTINSRRYAYSTDVEITGAPAISVNESETYTMTITNPAVDGPFSVTWSLDCAPSVAEIIAYNPTTCTVRGNQDMATFYLSGQVNNTNGTSFIKTTQLLVSVPGVIMNNITHPKIMAICYAQGWCASPNFMTEEEAAAVTDIGVVFRSKKLDASFVEFKYFTGLTQIPSNAFDRRGISGSALVSIELPPNINTINSYAFYSLNVNEKFSHIKLNEGLETIEDDAFAGCGVDGVTEWVMPSTLKTLREALSNIYGSKVILNEGLLTISGGVSMHRDNSAVTEPIVFPSTLTYVRLSVLSGFTKIEYKFPYSAMPVISGDFRGVSSVNHQPYDKGPVSLSDIKFPANWDKTPSGLFCFNSIIHLVLPDQFTAVGPLTFKGYSLETIYIPDSVTFIHHEAFGQNVYLPRSLASYRFPTHITELPNIMPSMGLLDLSMQAHITKVNRLTMANVTVSEFPSHITDSVDLSYWGSYIENTNQLPIPPGTRLNDYLFRSCNIITVDLPERITEIGNYTFDDCSFLTTVINKGTITKINTGAFRGCNALTSFQFTAPLNFLGGSAFGGTNLVTVDMNEDVVCSDLRNAFSSITSLKSVKVRSNVPNITFPALSAYSSNPNLEQIELKAPSGLIDNAFLSGCAKLKSIIFNVPVAPYTRSQEFGNNANNGSACYTGRDTYNTGENMLYVPAGATGYDQDRWASVLLNPDCCGFTISYTL